MATEPSFIERDAQTIVAEMVADYENRVGKRLEPAQVERLLINSFAYRELLIRNQVQQAALQNLLSFARYPMIDFLGELLGVKRLPASAAECTIQFTLVGGHGGVTIPEGLRVGTIDGRAVFQIKQDVVVLAGVTTATVGAVCQSTGLVGNDYAVDTVTSILDPQAYLTAATNTTQTAGGADEESDDELRERIKLAPSAFSTAGSKGAYQFHAKSAHPSIVDVAVTSSVPGTVEIYPLVAGGTTTPTEVLDAVEAACSADKVRPLTDTVVVASPTKVDYDIEVELTLYTGSDASTAITSATESLETYRDSRKNKLGLDVVKNQIIRASIVANVYDVNVVSPSADVIIGETEFSNCNSITVTVTGYNNG